jgi:TonB family protein
MQDAVNSVAGISLLESYGRTAPRRAWTAGAASVAVHLAAVLLLALMPPEFWRTRTSSGGGLVIEVPKPTPLVAPPFEITQKEPNQGKVSKEVNLESLLPKPRVQIPPSPPAPARPAFRLPAPLPAAPQPPPMLPEPPKVPLQVAAAPPAGRPEAPAPGPPPRIQTPEDNPKLAFESPAAAYGAGRQPVRGLAQIQRPQTSVQEAIRGAARGMQSGGLVLGDAGDAGAGSEAVSLPGQPGRQGSRLELLSDPQGVDFRPYLTLVLSAVRRNWFAVIPESAKLGRRGRVQIQFAISRDGNVPKLVISTPSGTDSLDRAAVAGVSASNPFPPLPAEFHGNEIRLQFTFLYNLR